MFRAVRVLALVAVAVLGAGGLALADSPPVPERRALEIDAARERALTSEFQRELPSDEAIGTGSGSGSSRGKGSAAERLRGPGDRRDRRDRSIDTRQHRPEEAGPLGSLMTFLLWGLVIVTVALLAFWFGSELLKGDDNPELQTAEAEAAAAAETAGIIARPLGDADELARRGEFAEAIHTLLLRTLEELVRSAAVRVQRSHTSREILSRVPLLADAREAFADLITAVELTHFGDEPANAADYDRCRQQFHRFATAFRATGMAAAPRGARAVPA